MISIYGLIDPRDGQLRYVGKTTNVAKRMETHYCEARAGNRLYSRRWLAGLLVMGMRAEVFILEEVTKDAADEAERFWIAAMRLAGCRLTNRTPGGDGQPKGYKPTAEAVMRGAEKTRGRKRTPEQIERLRTAFNRPEEKQRRRELYAQLKAAGKMSGRKVGSELTEEHKRRISDSWTPKRKAEHAAAQRAKPVDERWKAQLAAAIRARWNRYGSSA